MSTELESPLPIFRVGVSQISITFMNGLPQAEAKVHLLTAEGTVVAETTFSSFEKGSWKAIDSLSKQIELDFCKIIQGDGFFQWNEEPKENGISYTDQEGEWK